MHAIQTCTSPHSYIVSGETLDGDLSPLGSIMIGLKSQLEQCEHIPPDLPIFEIAARESSTKPCTSEDG